MAFRYLIPTVDAEGVLSVCDLQWLGTPRRPSVEGVGTFSIEGERLDTPRQIMRPTVAKIRLQADESNFYAELFTEKPKQWLCQITRAGQKIFVGYLLNDSITEDFVNNTWIVEFEAVDGLEDLENTEYRDENKELYAGRATLRDILRRCLLLTTIEIDTRFVSTSDSTPEFPVKYVKTKTPLLYEDYFDQYVEQRNFLERDGFSAWSAFDIIETILRPVNGFIVQFEGVWTVMWSLSLANPSLGGILNFTRYNFEGTQLPSEEINLSQIIGSEIDGYYPHHAGDNQVITRKASVGAAKFVHDYSFLADLLENGELINDGSAPIVGWTIDQPDAITLLGDENSVQVGLAVGAPSETDPALTSDLTVTDVIVGQIVKFQLTIEFPDPKPFHKERFRVTLSDGVTTYYLDENGPWETSPRRLEVLVDNGPQKITPKWESDPAPITGQIQVIVYPVDDLNGFGGLYGQTSIISDINIGAISQQQVEIQQSETTARKLEDPSPVVIEPQISQLGDASFPDGDLFDAGTVYISTIYETDSTTPAKNGYRSGNLFPQPLNTVAATDALILQSQVSRIFKGKVYGYIPPMARIQINNQPGLYVVTNYSWDAFENITELELYQVFWQDRELPPFPSGYWFNDLEVEVIDTDAEISKTTNR